MRPVIFFGSPSFSATLLTMMHDNAHALRIKIALVITQPSRPAGRGMASTPTPVMSYAQSQNIPTHIYSKDTVPTLVQTLKTFVNPIGVVFAFNEMIPAAILDIFPQGLWNVHPSLLPAYRGASPIAYPLCLGETTLGVTVMRMVKAMDAGPILAQLTVQTDTTTSRDAITTTLTKHGFALLTNLMQKSPADLASHSYEQNHTLASYTRKILRSDGFIEHEALSSWLHGSSVKLETSTLLDSFYKRNPQHTPPEYLAPSVLFDLWRGLSPWPGLWTTVHIKDVETRLKITGVRMLNEKPLITHVQMEGKKEVLFSQWNEVYKAF